MSETSTGVVGDVTSEGQLAGTCPLLDLESWCRRVGWTGPATLPDEALREVSVGGRVLDDFAPLGSCLEYRVAEHYWASVGTSPFAAGEVPYLINNSGTLSSHLVHLLFAACVETPPQDKLRVVEVGAGSGLFARLFLDGFQELCAQEQRDYYDRLEYTVTDRSAAAVEQWARLDLFGHHRGHVVTASWDAAEGWPTPEPVRVVVCNYLLDVLPTAIVRRGAEGPEQLWVRTHLAGDDALLRRYSPHSYQELRSCVLSGEGARMRELFAVTTLFEVELAFRRDGARELPEIDSALEDYEPGERVLHNYGAWQYLRLAMAHVAPAGFVLINDYGPTRIADVVEHSGLQRFGSTTAIGLNFPLLEGLSRRQGWRVSIPSGDHDRPLHSRLISHQELAQVATTFEARFGAELTTLRKTLLDDAREHVREGRLRQALEAYRQLVVEEPRDWLNLAEVIEFLNVQLGDHAAALSLARVAVELNPCYSAGLWNALGDALSGLGRFEEAHEAYLQAERIDPNDVATNLKLACSHLQASRLGPSLSSIARGLEHDADEALRARLLETQRHVLTALSAKHALERERHQQRKERFAFKRSP